MSYLTTPTEVRAHIAKLATAKILWVDTETADWNTSYPTISLIQVLADSKDLTGDKACILDVLQKPDLVSYFINQIMANPQIEKVFHNARYDIKFLGKDQAQNVSCTLNIAKKIGIKRLKVQNLKLKTLAEELCQFSNVDKEEQASNWKRRPLTDKQLHYAKMDTVYLAQIHRRLLEIANADNVSNILDMEVNGSKPKTQLYFSPTKIRVAFECPRLFYLKHRFGGNTLFVPAGTGVGIGKSFHNLADEFVSLAQREPRFRALFALPAEQLKLEEVTSQMQQLFYELAFYPYLQEIIKQDQSRASALLQLWEGLKGLIQRWAELLIVNRRYCQGEAVIRNTFVSQQERRIEHYFNLPDGTQQKVLGEFDCLIYNYELQRLCVVEFKTYQPVDLSAQLAQVALYSYILWAKKKVPVDSAVYCVLPEFKEYHYAWEDLEKTVHQLIPYKLQQMRQWLRWETPQPDPPPPTTQTHLCKICPQQQKCQTFFAIDGVPPVIISPQPEKSE